MASYTQANQSISMTTPLGQDVLLLIGLQGHEAISQLFRFELDLLAENQTEVPFDGIVGQNVTVAMQLSDGATRYINGIVSRFSQGDCDETFTRFRAEMIPQLWLLTRKVQSRIFQHLSVPEICNLVLTGLDVKSELIRHYDPRDYCVQYRESDFAFVSRLMEEEGIYYFFRHFNGRHQMVISDTPLEHPALPGQSDVVYESTRGGTREDMRVITWEKTQELRSGKYTLWDHCFEVPGRHLEAQQATIASVPVGQVIHKLQIGGNDQLEIYDYPGGYAQRFDGVDKGGANRPRELQKIFTDNVRTVEIRMEQEELPALEIRGTSDCRHFIAGHKFTLSRHFDADGPYLLTRVEHHARLGGDYRSGEVLQCTYQNQFTCIPAALAYRPPRVTPRPTIGGLQTATVVGPPGEELFCDKYGRVKVQFHWDRQGKKDLDSSCWIRVAQCWAGKGWGAFFWPRSGNEVVVAFEEGDPDRPLIIGSVYNAENMPPFALPLHKELGGFKSASVRGHAYEHFNGIVFDDEKGHEHLAIHSERHMTFNSEFDKSFTAGRHKGERVTSASVFTVGNLPGGGGSGGGWRPPPGAVSGLNSVMVYGENLQFAVGLNHQLALGSNIQICINPAGLAAGVPGFAAPAAVTGLLGGFMGGNMQLTIGTNASFVLGRSFDINLGPPKIEVKDGRSHVASFILCGILGALAVVWVILYAIFEDDNVRAKEAIGFQLVFDLLLSALMTVETMQKEADMVKDIATQTVFKDKEKAQNDLNDMFGKGDIHAYLESLGTMAAFCGALVLPLVAIALEDGEGFDKKTDDK